MPTNLGGLYGDDEDDDVVFDDDGRNYIYDDDEAADDSNDDGEEEDKEPIATEWKLCIPVGKKKDWWKFYKEFDKDAHPERKLDMACLHACFATRIPRGSLIRDSGSSTTALPLASLGI
jgi:hypothetical protein